MRNRMRVCYGGVPPGTEAGSPHPAYVADHMYASVKCVHGTSWYIFIIERVLFYFVYLTVRTELKPEVSLTRRKKRGMALVCRTSPKFPRERERRCLKEMYGESRCE